MVLVDEEGSWPKPSEIFLPDDADPMLKGIVDGLWEGLTGSIGFLIDYASDPEFRAGVHEGFKALINDPIGVIGGIIDEYAGMIDRLASGEGTDDDFYNLGMEIGEVSVGVVFGGSTLVAKATKKLLKKAPRSELANKTKKKLADCACFTGETQVMTSNGYKSIAQVNVGEKIWRYNQYTQALEVDELKGKKIEVSEDFTFEVGDNQVSAKDLKEGDKITLYDGDKIEVDKIEVIKGLFRVYSLDFESSTKE